MNSIGCRSFYGDFYIESNSSCKFELHRIPIRLAQSALIQLKMVNENIPEYLIAYLQGEANKTQSDQAHEWLKDPENQDHFSQLEEIDHLSNDFALLSRFDLNAGRERVKRKYRSQRFGAIFRWAQRAAAILFIPVLFGAMWYYLQQNELRQKVTSLIVNQTIVTQPGTKTHLYLPDSTEVWLNASSKLSFPSVFSGSERRIVLDGEAYFEVYKDKRRPFIVVTKFQEVEALGTIFNLSAYSDDFKFSTTLAEGKVKVTDLKSSNATFLEPGKQLNYVIKGSTYQEIGIRVKDVISWKDGILIFNETPFYEVAVKLGRWFNADIKITDQSIANYRFTGTFTDESLDQVLELLRLSTPIDYSSSRRKIQANRSFSKQEIKIRMK